MTTPPRERDFDFGRTVALSDGVFAIALTILVISIAVPQLPDARAHELPHALIRVVPQVLTYALSFAVIARFWVRHHQFFGDLARIDGTLVTLNLLYLALVAFVPFPTALLGKYGDQPVAAALYGATIACIVAVATVTRAHAHRADLVSPEATREPLRGALVSAAVFGASIPLAFVSPTISEALWFVGLVVGRAVVGVTASDNQAGERRRERGVAERRRG